MSFPAYESYKNSGADWLGQIPVHWLHVPARRLFSQIREPARDTDEQLSATQRYGVIPQSLFMALEDQKVVLALKGTDAFKHVEHNDFVISLRSFQGGIERSTYSGCVSPAYTVLRPHSRVDAGFWTYLLKDVLFISALQSATDGIREGKTISYDQFGNLTVPLPTAAEQVAIAAFLDRETAKIDALVEAQRRLIELLKQKRQAVISHAVTKGLDPSAPMKDSGVEWLGQVPAQWDLCQLKHLIFFQRGHDLPTQDRREGDIPIHSSGGLLGYHDEAAACGPAIVTGRYGTIGEFEIVDGPYWPLNTALYSVELHGHVAFTRYVLESLRPLFLMHAAKSAVPGVDRNDIHRLLIAIPNPQEQAEIATHLDHLSAKWRDLLDEARATIGLLQERRAALISAAVTGKIDVRDVAHSTTSAEAA